MSERLKPEREATLRALADNSDADQWELLNALSDALSEIDAMRADPPLLRELLDGPTSPARRVVLLDTLAHRVAAAVPGAYLRCDNDRSISICLGSHFRVSLRGDTDRILRVLRALLQF